MEVNVKKISRINGPVVKATGDTDFAMQDMVLVGEEKLIGEVISIHGEEITIQVYESTSGLKPGAPVESVNKPLSVTLGPGIIGNIFDGIQRPLFELYRHSGSFMSKGLSCDSIDKTKEWHFFPKAKIGDTVRSLSIVGEVYETGTIINKIMIPYLKDDAEIISIAIEGYYNIEKTIAEIKLNDGTILPVKMVQEWPVRVPRPYRKRMAGDEPLITGQRVIDTLFPIARGGTAAIPGSFGTGKTMTQHQLAQWCDADIIVYIGCGERGNEMTEVLEDFPKLTDPRTNRSLMERTVLIANTSNMPVAAREASVYTGITIAEYYRDMGYDVAVMADSTSRWAEALREISGRLEEMPAEEGFPAYLPSRLSEFYGRAGNIVNLNGTKGSVSIIGAVSPQGGDFSEPVTQNTKRFVRCFWGLDRSLAYSRHYPAIHWLTSYSEYLEDLDKWYQSRFGREFANLRSRFTRLLQEENEIMEIVKLVGQDVLPEEQKLTLECGRVIRVGFLQQNAFSDLDTYVPLAKQFGMMSVIIFLFDKSMELIKIGIPVSVIKDKGYFEECINMKYNISNIEKDHKEQFDNMRNKFEDGLRDLLHEYEEHGRKEIAE